MFDAIVLIEVDFKSVRLALLSFSQPDKIVPTREIKRMGNYEIFHLFTNLN